MNTANYFNKMIIIIAKKSVETHKKSSPFEEIVAELVKYYLWNVFPKQKRKKNARHKLRNTVRMCNDII